MGKKKKQVQELPSGVTEEDLVRRAMVAWIRGGGSGVDMPANTSSVEEWDGKLYVRLEGAQGDGPLAVYRLRQDGILKRMKRWPVEVE